MKERIIKYLYFVQQFRFPASDLDEQLLFGWRQICWAMEIPPEKI
jgi:hypothetical protein